MNISRDTLVTLLRTMGGRKEVEQYLRHFCSVDSQKFAVIQIDGGILDDQLDMVAAALSYLHQVGLSPMVVHGAGPQIERALAAARLPTGAAADAMAGAKLDVVRRTYQEQNLALVEALELRGCGARPIAAGVFEAELLDDSNAELVGRVTGVDELPVLASMRSGHLPIMTSLATTSSGQLLQTNPDAAARLLARVFEPHKIIFLTLEGGIFDGKGHLISAVNLAEDFAPLMAQSWLSPDMRMKLQEIKGLLVDLPESSSVSITAPAKLARELFTHRGAGTLLRRGERINCFGAFSEVDCGRLRQLIEGCFGRQLAAGYFDEKDCYRLYLSSAYRATAVVVAEGGLPYLDKFAVTQKAQGEGLGGSLWARMRKDNPKLFWRSRRTNAVNAWYFQQADGSYQSDEWTVFWCGLSGFSEIENCVERALAMPATLHG
jgi:bifunctional N-acetylglutamate synthase/kinase